MNPPKKLASLNIDLGYKELIILLSMLISLTALSIDALLPANPQFAVEFDIVNGYELQLIVNVFFLGFAISQLLFGPLSDRFGRKPILFIGLAIFILASVLAITSTTFKMLLVARFLQGFGCGAPRIIPISITRDLTHGREMARIISLTMMVFILIPIIAPSIGQLILYLGTWKLIFYLFILMAVILILWVWTRLPETLLIEDRQPLNFSALSKNFKFVLNNRMAMGYCFSLSFIFGAFNIYLSASQLIFDKLYGLKDSFAFIFGAIALCLGIANYFNANLVLKLGMRKICHMALILFVALSLIFIFACLIYQGLPPAWLFILLMAGMLFLVGIIFPNQNALAMEPMGKLSGTAASIIGSISTVVGIFLGTIAGWWIIDTLYAMAIAFCLYSLIALILFNLTKSI